MLRPQKQTPRLPKNEKLDIAVCNIDDERGLRSALRDVDTIFHFATAEHQKDDSDLECVDIRGTQSLIEVAQEANVSQLLFLGRVGSDKSSSFPVLRAKAFAENAVRNSGINYCILKLTDVFGKNDHFSSEIADAIKAAPLLLPYPGGGGKSIVQPLWIEDLLSIIMLVHETKKYNNEIFEIGGGEYFEFVSLAKKIMQVLQKQKILVQMSPAYLRLINLWFKSKSGRFPLSTRWLDLLAIDRTCTLDSLPRYFSVLPSRFQNHLDYLSGH